MELNLFPLNHFCSMLIEQLINLRKVRPENLKFRTDLRDPVIDSWSVTQKLIIFSANATELSVDLLGQTITVVESPSGHVSMLKRF